MESSNLTSLVDDFTSARITRRECLLGALALGLSLPAATALLSACGSSASSAGSASPTPASVASLTMRLDQDMSNIDPAFIPTHADGQICDAVCEGLVSFKPGTWDVVNTLAESLELSSDNQHYHFTLKQGIPFHKGYGEVTAQDVKFSFERIAGLTKPNINATYQGDWAPLETVQVNGKYEGTIVLKNPFAPIGRTTLPWTSGKVLSQKAVEGLGKQYATHPIGTGPYEFVNWVPKQQITLQRFASYGGANSAYAPKTQVDKLILLPITNDTAALNGLLAGNIDVADIGTENVAQVQGASGISLYKAPTLAYYFLAMNCNDPLLSNINLRKAIRSAINVPNIISAAYNGQYERAYAIIPESMGMGYWPQAPHYDQNLDEARSYLNQSGLKNVTLTLAALNDTTDETVAQVIQSNLSSIGIKVAIQPQDAATFYAIPGAGGGGRHRQLVYAFYDSEPDPWWSFEWWNTAQKGLWNWDNWSTKEFDGLLRQANLEQDASARTELYIKAQQLWDEAAGMAWIAYITNLVAAKKQITPSLRPDGQAILWNFRVA